MNGDISLSQSFGGLRIANPDDGSPPPVTDAIASPPSAAANSYPSTFSSHSTTSTIRDPRPDENPVASRVEGTGGLSLDFDPATYALGSLITAQSPALHDPTAQDDDTPPSPSVVRRKSVPGLSSVANAHPSASLQQHGSLRHMHSPASAAHRPRNQSTPYDVPSQVPNSLPSNYAQYRMGEEHRGMSHDSGMNRSSSRGASQPRAGPPPVRQGSRIDRGYPPTVTPAGVGETPYPLRRSSRALPMGQNYGSEAALPTSSEEWKERGAATRVQQAVDANGNTVTRTTRKGVKDFNFGRTLGEGSYSTVLAATDRQTLIEYAIKVLDKRHIIKEKKVKYVNIERDTLNRLTEHPGIVKLYYTFQDERSLYFVLDLATGGELLGVLKKMGTFDEECTRFYGAQILDAVDYMHTRGIIHRDLKPENVLLNDRMQVKITDFGTAKLLDLNTQPEATGAPSGSPLDGADNSRANSFVGTAEYVSPELLTDKNACKASDLWAFGCILYQLLAGRPPFRGTTEYLTFQKIVALEYTFPAGFPEVARDLIERLLVLDPAKRLPIEHIKRHPFFDGVKWGKGLWSQKAPRLKAYTPPDKQPIKLNGSDMAASAAAKAMAGSSAAPQRPQLRAITELPPPSQLDIEWSPVLTRNNERILKLGNLNVTVGAAPPSPTTKPGDFEQQQLPQPQTKETKKLSRFFTTNKDGKKRQRLVMITSSARIVLAAAGGEEKKAKLEISLLGHNTSWKTFKDARGLTAWSVDTRDKHIVFEDPRANPIDPDGSLYLAQEWLQTIEQAKDFALSQSLSQSYSGASTFNELDSTISSPSSTLGGLAAHSTDNLETIGLSRHTLRKETDGESMKGRKRFSKRQSKSGLAAVF